MKGINQSLINVLIQKDVLIKRRHIKQISKLFLNETDCPMAHMVSEEFIKQKEYFLENPQYYIDNNKKIERLKYIKIEDPIYSYKYRKSGSRKNNKNIRCIFFIYEGRIIVLDIFEENDDNGSAYKDAIKRAVSEYKIIVEGGKDED